MVVFPNAKINLGLNIITKRLDGYHDIESIFYPIGICDELEINVNGKDSSSLIIEGMSIPGSSEDNLIMKAWKLMQQEFSLGHVDIRLDKKIPMGGGVGGGSADCGAFINLVNDYFKLKLSIERREEIAAILGSDCPFFIKNKPAYVTGRGEILEPIAEFLKGVYLVLVYGDRHISTREAYVGISPIESGHDLREVVLEDIRQWKATIANDFEIPVFAKYPELGKLKERLYACGAAYASLTGTGSCLYGLFESEPVELGPIEDKIVWKGFL